MLSRPVECAHERSEMDCSDALPPDSPILVVHAGDDHQVGSVGFALCPGEVNVDRVEKVYFLALNVPRPSHDQDCDVCFEQTTGLAFDFPCGHFTCLQCAIQWSKHHGASRMTCPFCRNNEIASGDYLSSSNNLEVLMVGPFACFVAYNKRVPHLDLPFAHVKIVHETPGWWDSMYISPVQRRPVRMILEAAHEGYSKEIQKMALRVYSRCGWCGASGCSVRCSRCKQVDYCGIECQKRHWKRVHKTQCGSL